MTGAGWAGCRETHISAVYFVGDKVLKLKKPVRNDFLDFTTRQARLHACEEEVRLNRRLSPDVYLGVAEIDLGEQTPEPAVVMRRLDDCDNLAALVGGEPTRLIDGVQIVARQVAALHEAAPPVAGADSPGAWHRVVAAWQREWDAIADLNPALSSSHRRGAGLGLGLRYLSGRRALFSCRLLDGRIRDGHGDLRADHVYLTPDGVRIVDCLEFDTDLRTCDVVADIAFLAMDLERLDEAAAAAHLIETYRELTGDVFPPSLVDFYIAQRALVRLKVALLQSGPRTRAAMREEDRFLDLAEGHLVAAQPVVLCVGGLPGSGKSTLASVLAGRGDLVYLSSDAIRHELASGRDNVPHDEWESGRYQPTVTAGVYAEMLSRARTALALGFSVVLDASWRDAAQRDKAAAAAAEAGAVLGEILCVVDDKTARRRLRGGRPGFSEAGVAERTAMQRTFAPWSSATVISTDGEFPQIIRTAEEALAAARRSAVGPAIMYPAPSCQIAVTEPAATGEIHQS